MSFNKSEALDAAKQYVLQRNLPAALEIYQKIVQVDPDDLAAMNTLGDLYASTGNIKDAIDQFTKLAAIYIGGGFSRKAITALKKIIAVDPANIETAIKLADLYAEAGLPSEARQHYLQIAEALTRKGQRLDALNVYTKVVELDPMNTPTRIKLGELCLREGMNDKAYDAFMIAADQLAQKGEHRRALNAYNEALSIKPGNVEAMTAQRKLMDMLGVADRPSQPAGTVDSASQKPSQGRTAPLGSQSPVGDKPHTTESSFVVQEISKAEILVAYGQVTQALGMLRNVLRENPDSIELHIKLKDIYLRTGMMAEAATECRELERIHQSRGESDRARDYAIRASRLTNLLEQPSGDLETHEPKKVPAEPQVKAAPPMTQSKNPAPVAASQNPALIVPPQEPAPVAAPQKPSPVASPQKPATVASPQKPAPVAAPQKPAPVAPGNPAPAAASQNPGRVVTPQKSPAPTKPKAPEPKPLPVTTRIDLPVAPAARVPISVTEEKPPVIAVAETRSPDLRIPTPSVAVEEPTAMVTAKMDENPLLESSFGVLPQSVVDVAVAAFSLPARLRAKLTSTAIAAAAVVLLAISAVIGGFVYNSYRDKSYQTLTVTMPPSIPPSPPAESKPVESRKQVVQNNTTPNSVRASAGAAPEVPTRRESRDAVPVKIERPPTPAPQPDTRSTKIASPVLPVLPKASFSADTRVGADSRTPAGVPVEVPIGANQPVEPPAKAVRQSPGVVLGSATKKVDPIYPSAARSAGQSGSVKVEVSINERGDVVSARALSGPALLQGAAVGAARAWKFKASTLGGVPVPTTTTIVFNFKL